MSTTVATGNNTGLPDGTKIADDLIGTGTPPSTGDRVQYVKLDVGAAGLSSPVSGSIPIQDGGNSLTVDGSVSVSNFPVSQAVTGTFFQATQPVSLASAPTTAVTNAGLTNLDVALSTRLKPADTLAAVTAITNPVTANQGSANATPWNENVAQVGGVAVVAGAKGTQQTNAIPTQDMKDAGRTPIVLTLDSLSGITTEALATMSINSGGTVTSATSYTVTAGKKLRISSIVHDCIVPSTTGCASRLRLRGAASSFSATSPIYLHSAVGTSATAFAGFSEDMAIPDGLEFPAGFIIGLSHIESSAIAGSTTTGAGVHACIIGYEY